MSPRACYIERSEGGSRIVGLRLIGDRTDDRWAAPADDTPAAVLAAAAGWIAQRLRGAGESSLTRLSLDSAGTMCSWVSTPSDDPMIVAAACEQTDMLPIVEKDEPLAGPVSPASVQVLAEPGTLRAGAPARRVAALADRDVIGRLLADELDERGIHIEHAGSFLHDIARAWDPAAPGADSARREGENIVESQPPLCAVVVVEPGGRLSWSWSTAGALDAGGTLLVGGATAAEHVQRLTMDWLAWSAQLGRVPVRIVCVGVSAGGLSLGEFAQALARTWGRATTDAVEDEDPVGTTLRRAMGPGSSPDDPRGALVRLSNRPGRLHRGMWRWGAIALAALAAFLGVVSWHWWAMAGDLRTLAATHETTWRAEIAQAVPDLAASERPMTELRSRVETLRPKKPTSPVPAAKPILEELRLVSEQISGYELVRLSMGSGLQLAPRISLRVTDTRDAEELGETFRTLTGSNVAWTWGFNPTNDTRGRIGCDLQGLWHATEPGP